MGKTLDKLTLLADKYGCDKGSIKHNYTKIYNKYFSNFKDKKFKMLEIGYGEGASIKMWLDYFPKVNIYCIDIIKTLPSDKKIKKHIKEGRFTFLNADQTSMKQMSKLFDIDRNDFKIIIDDGSHRPEDEIYTLNCLIPYLSKRGFYIIEDLNCKRSHNKKFKFKEKKMVDILKQYKNTSDLNIRNLTEAQIEYIKNSIGKVDIYNDKIAFIQKTK